eukprot:355731-Chlamydomonas_euryale.AAC.2
MAGRVRVRYACTACACCVCVLPTAHLPHHGADAAVWYPVACEPPQVVQVDAARAELFLDAVERIRRRPKRRDRRCRAALAPHEPCCLVAAVQRARRIPQRRPQALGDAVQAERAAATCAGQSARSTAEAPDGWSACSMPPAPLRFRRRFATPGAAAAADGFRRRLGQALAQLRQAALEEAARGVHAAMRDGVADALKLRRWMVSKVIVRVVRLPQGQTGGPSPRTLRLAVHRVNDAVTDNVDVDRAAYRAERGGAAGSSAGCEVLSTAARRPTLASCRQRNQTRAMFHTAGSTPQTRAGLARERLCADRHRRDWATPNVHPAAPSAARGPRSRRS